VSTTFKDNFHAAVLEYIREHCDCKDSVSVVSVTEKTERSGYCDTCWSEYAVVHVRYTKADDEEDTATIITNYADFVRRLTSD